MSKFSIVFCAAAFAVFTTTAFADDPDMQQNGSSNCAQPGGQPWCASEHEAVDTSTGLTTVEYVFNLTNIPATNENDWSGWVEGLVNGLSGQEAELLHFVNLGTALAPINAVFLYCGNAAAICSSNNAGLPLSENSNVTAKFNMGTTPLTNPSNTYNPTATGPGNETYGGYSIGFNGSSIKGTNIPAPEPSGVLLLGAMMIGVAGFARRKSFGRA